MAERKESEKEHSGERRYSGFDAPTIGTVLPKGTKIRHNPDGTVTLIPPENNDKADQDSEYDTDEEGGEKLTAEALVEWLLTLYPDRTYPSVTGCPFYSELSAMAKERGMTAGAYLNSLGFNKKLKGPSEEQILDRLRELYPSGEYSSVGDIKKRDPELHKHLSVISKDKMQTVMRYLSRHEFRKAAVKMHTNRLDRPWDRHTPRRLYYEYELTYEQLASLFDCSKQSVSIQISSRKDNGNDSGWETALNEQELLDAGHVIASGETFSADELRTVMILTGRMDRSI